MPRINWESAFSLLTVLAHALAPLVQRLLPAFRFGALNDLPKLESNWVVCFREPAFPAGANRVAVDATLRQKGRRITGEGHIQGQLNDIFYYEGKLKRNVLYGTFWRRDASVLAGTGSFVLRIDADNNRMAGSCSWFDSGIDDVWTSEYDWRRQG